MAHDVRWTKCVGATYPTWKAVQGRDPAGLAYVIFEAHQQAKARWQVSLPEVVTAGAAFATMTEAKAHALTVIAPVLAARAAATAEAEAGPLPSMRPRWRASTPSWRQTR